MKKFLFCLFLAVVVLPLEVSAQTVAYTQIRVNIIKLSAGGRRSVRRIVCIFIEMRQLREVECLVRYAEGRFWFNFSGQ